MYHGHVYLTDGTPMCGVRVSDGYAVCDFDGVVSFIK